MSIGSIWEINAPLKSFLCYSRTPCSRFVLQVCQWKKPHQVDPNMSTPWDGNATGCRQDFGHSHAVGPREVQKNKSCWNNWLTPLKSWPTRSKNTTKNFRSKFGPEPSPHGHALFFRIFLQVKKRKMRFSARSFRISIFKPCYSNINRRKRFRLMLVSSWFDHAFCHFLTTPTFNR